MTQARVRGDSNSVHVRRNGERAAVVFVALKDSRLLAD